MKPRLLSSQNLSTVCNNNDYIYMILTFYMYLSMGIQGSAYLGPYKVKSERKTHQTDKNRRAKRPSV